MKVLILGGEGMLGHKMFQVLSQRFEVYATCREAQAGIDAGITHATHLFNAMRGIGKTVPGAAAAAAAAGRRLPD